MAKNRNKKKRNGAASIDVSEGTFPDLPRAMDTSETGVQKTDSVTAKLMGMVGLKDKCHFLAQTRDRKKIVKKMKKGRPMKRSKNVRKMKAMAKAIAKNEKYAAKNLKNDSKKARIQLAKVLYD